MCCLSTKIRRPGTSRSLSARSDTSMEIGNVINLSIDAEDIIDEVLLYFRANVLFRNFEVRGSADRTLIYLTMHAVQCLVKCERIEDKPSGASFFELYLSCLMFPQRCESCVLYLKSNLPAQASLDGLWEGYLQLQ